MSKFHQIPTGAKFHQGKNASKNPYDISYKVFQKIDKSTANLLEVHKNNGEMFRKHNFPVKFSTNVKVFPIS